MQIGSNSEASLQLAAEVFVKTCVQLLANTSVYEGTQIYSQTQQEQEENLKLRSDTILEQWSNG